MVKEIIMHLILYGAMYKKCSVSSIPELHAQVGLMDSKLCLNFSSIENTKLRENQEFQQISTLDDGFSAS